jgi:hypothetical protein
MVRHPTQPHGLVNEGVRGVMPGLPLTSHGRGLGGPAHESSSTLAGVGRDRFGGAGICALDGGPPSGLTRVERVPDPSLRHLRQRCKAAKPAGAPRRGRALRRRASQSEPHDAPAQSYPQAVVQELGRSAIAARRVWRMAAVIALLVVWDEGTGESTRTNAGVPAIDRGSGARRRSHITAYDRRILPDALMPEAARR